MVTQPTLGCSLFSKEEEEEEECMIMWLLGPIRLAFSLVSPLFVLITRLEL